MSATQATSTQTEASAQCFSSRERLDSNITTPLIEQVLASLGVHATLSELVRGAQFFESAISNRVRATRPESICAE